LNAPTLSPARGTLLLLLLSIVMYLTALGAAPIHRHQEARVAEVAREMSVSGDLIVPRLNGTVRLNKPPLVYWAVLGSYELLGAIDEFAARLPVALCAIAGILLTAALAARLFGPRAGLIAGAVLATTPLYVSAGRRAETDVPMALFAVLALHAFERGFIRQEAGWRWLFFAGMGLAFMSKGVPGVVVPLLAALLYLFWEGRLRDAARPSFLGGLLLTLLIIAPWYAVIWKTFPDAAAVFRFETLHRLGEDAPHAHPFYFYLYVLPVQVLPWVLLAPFAWSGIRGDGETRRAARLPAAWLAGGLGFLMLLETKQPHYLVPLLPAIAILLGGGLDRAIASSRRPWLRGSAVAGLTVLLAAGTLLYTGLVEKRFTERNSPIGMCRRVLADVGSRPLIYYRFDDSACTFYIGRTVPIADDEEILGSKLVETPGAFVFTRERDAGAPALAGHSVLWRSEDSKRRMVLLGPPG